MYVFLSGAAAAREGRWEGTEEAGVEGGKEGNGSVLLPLANSAPQIWGRGGLEKVDYEQEGVELRDLKHLHHQPQESSLWHRYTSVFILNLLSVSIYVSLPA